ncbi:MAG: hypothetical protein ACREQD_13725, partial [Candidatus Binataceae bacterium]
TLIVRAEAEADLAVSELWYEQQHDGLGARFVAEIDATFRRIEANPTAFDFVRGKLRRALVRRFPFGVFNALTERHIVVVAVLMRRTIRACGGNARGLTANNRWRGP